MYSSQNKVKSEFDILEIDSILHDPCGFDIEKAKQIIRKHNKSNMEFTIA